MNEHAQNVPPQNMRPAPVQGTRVMVTGLGRIMTKAGPGVRSMSGGIVKTVSHKPWNLYIDSVINVQAEKIVLKKLEYHLQGRKKCIFL